MRRNMLFPEQQQVGVVALCTSEQLRIALRRQSTGRRLPLSASHEYPLGRPGQNAPGPFAQVRELRSRGALQAD